jgi:dTMP kinase
LRGKLITIEGCEGAGKSTQLALLRAFLSERGVDAVFTREPGGTSVSERIRGLILDAANREMTGRTELLLYAAARAQHIEELIEPALARGALVVCDRFSDSTLAYQGYARGMDLGLVRAADSMGTGGVLPDLTLFLDIEPKAAFLRKGGADSADRLENEGLAFHESVYRGYLEIARREPDRFVRVDAGPTEPERIFASILGVLKARGILL